MANHSAKVDGVHVTKPLLMTTDEVAELLGVSTRTVMRMAAAGDLPGTVRVRKLWRFNRAKVEQFAGIAE